MVRVGSGKIGVQEPGSRKLLRESGTATGFGVQTSVGLGQNDPSFNTSLSICSFDKSEKAIQTLNMGLSFSICKMGKGDLPLTSVMRIQ